ncbi:MAG: hypothetical protein GX751_04795 [Desulfuromonadaceae bacterium]|nr:hypothetical protein [Desulfuromonadaceae bacterium]
MLIVMKKNATEENLSRVKLTLTDLDLDFHQSTGAERTILGVIGDTDKVCSDLLRRLPGVLEVFKIPRETP